jgi:iron complex outermembrane receptor protein
MKPKKSAVHGLACAAALATALCWRLDASAQTPGVSEADFLTDMPIVLSVSRLPQPLDETPGAVTLIDRDMIRLSGARDVADLLRLVPGFQTSSSFETGAPLVSYHGGFDGYSNRMQVLVDGRSVYSPYLTGGTSIGLQSVALGDIERIEVLRGSNSAAYGARAMLGVINIITRHSLDSLGLQLGVNHGENGIDDASLQLGWGQENASYRVSIERRADDGLSGSFGHNQVLRANLRADLHTGPNDDVQLRAGTLEIDSGKGFANQPTDPARDRLSSMGYLQLDWQRNLGQDQDLAMSFSHSEETYKDFFALSLIPYGVNSSVNIDFSGRSSMDAASVQHTVRVSPALRYVWGGEFRREQVWSKSLYNTDKAFVSDFSRLFGNAEWRLNKDWLLNAGAMAERSSVNGDSLAPRLMLNWHAWPGNTLRFGVSSAHRPPSSFEQFSDVRYFLNDLSLQAITVARGQVRPERVLVQELGYVSELARTGVSLDVRAYNEQIDGFVRRQQYALPAGTTLIPSYPWDYVNSENFFIQGLEYQLKWRPWRDGHLLFNQSFTHISSQDPGSSQAAPRMAWSLAYFQKLPGGLDFSLMHQDSGIATTQGAGDADLSAMTRTDVRLGLPLRWGARRGELALVLQNLGAPYQDFAKVFQFERRAFVSLRIEN